MCKFPALNFRVFCMVLLAMESILTSFLVPPPFTQDGLSKVWDVVVTWNFFLSPISIELALSHVKQFSLKMSLFLYSNAS